MKHQHIILRVVITFILLSNISWAMDIDDVPRFSSEIQLLDIDENNKEPAQVHCDHCCHGSAHYVGLFSRATTFTPINNRSFPRITLRNNYTYTHQPPTPPPTA